jgi:hypothetical protein
LVAKVSARFSALAAALDAVLEGDDDNGGGFRFGGGGKVILFVTVPSVGPGDRG